MEVFDARENTVFVIKTLIPKRTKQMGYYTRVFCTADQKPTIREVIEACNRDDLDINVEDNHSDLQSTNWTDFTLVYDFNQKPLLVDLHTLGNSNGLVEEEIEEFLELIEVADAYASDKKKVIAHLEKTKYIVSIQLPVSDMTKMGYEVNDRLMNYFEENYEGMIQEDDEGFYDKGRLFLEL